MTLTRHSFLQLAGAAAASKAAAQSRTPKARPLNVLLITTDQEQPWSHVPGKLGLRHHERLMERSVHFAKWMSNTSPCAPARSILYTGQHLQKTRVVDNPGVPPWPNKLSTDTPTLGTYFAEAGYRTVYKGKWHLSEIRGDAGKNHRAGLRAYGFQDYQEKPEAVGLAWDGYEHDPEIAADAVKWLMEEGRASDQPWLLTVNFLNPHDIMFYDATGRMNQTRLQQNGPRSPLKPAPEKKPYGTAKRMGLPKNFSLDRSRELPAHRVFREDNELFLGVIEDSDEAGWLNFANYYADCLRDVDTQLGIVLDGLARAGLADRTVVIFTADHGEMAGAHGQRQKGPFIYAENLGVPMIVRHPDVRGGATSTALGSSVDLVSTALGLAGVDVEAIRARHPGLAGYDLAGAVADARATGARGEKAGGVLLGYSSLYSGSPDVRRKRARASLEPDPVKRAAIETAAPYDVDYQYRTFMRGLFDGRYKFARYFSPRDHHTPADWANLTGRNDLELYDTAADPLEMNNLAHAAETRRDLILGLNDHLNRLVAAEVGIDDGAHMPSPAFLWRI